MSLIYNPSKTEFIESYKNNSLNFYDLKKDELGGLSEAQYAILNNINIWDDIPYPQNKNWWNLIINQTPPKVWIEFEKYNPINSECLDIIAKKEYADKKSICPDELYLKAISIFEKNNNSIHTFEYIAGLENKNRLDVLLKNSNAKEWIKPSNGDTLLHVIVRQDWSSGIKIAKTYCDESKLNFDSLTAKQLASELKLTCYLKSESSKSSFGEIKKPDVKDIKSGLKKDTNQLGFDF